MFVLGIDTSSAAVAVDVTEAAGPSLRVLARRAPVSARGHGELLAATIAECLAEAGLTARELGAIVAGVGPGPYTGLRVGLVTAAALGHALDIATYGVCSLDAITSGAEGESVVVTDARRKEVYWARYDERGHRVDGPQVDRPADVSFGGVANIAGAAVGLYADVWPTHLTRLPSEYPEPAQLIALALDRVRSAAPAESLTPLYLRHPDAVVPGAPKPVSQ